MVVARGMRCLVRVSSISCLEVQLRQQGRHGEQTAVGCPRVKRRQSRKFVGLWTICRKALFGAGFLAMLAFGSSPFGDPLEVEFAKPGSFVNSFLPRFFGSPNGSFKSQPY